MGGNFLLPFSRTRTADKALESVQDWIERFVAVFRRNPLMDGQFIEGQDLPGPLNEVRHGLARPPRGCLFLAQNEAPGLEAVVGQCLFMARRDKDVDPAYWPTKEKICIFAFHYTAALRADLWVF